MTATLDRPTAVLTNADRTRELGNAIEAEAERDERVKILRGLAKLGSDVLGDHPLPGEVLRAASPRTFAEPITLRTNWGSHRVVAKVYAYDAMRGKVFVKFAARPQYGELAATEEVDLGELEALDANRRFVPVEGVVRSMTNEVNE